MALRVEWTQWAMARLDQIGGHIARELSRDPTEIVNGILESVKPLAEHPKMGRMVPEIVEEDIREIIKGRYRVIYQVTEKIIFVLSVIHGRQDLSVTEIKKVG